MAVNVLVALCCFSSTTPIRIRFGTTLTELVSLSRQVRRPVVPSLASLRRECVPRCDVRVTCRILGERLAGSQSLAVFSRHPLRSSAGKPPRSAFPQSAHSSWTIDPMEEAAQTWAHDVRKATSEGVREGRITCTVRISGTGQGSGRGHLAMEGGNILVQSIRRKISIGDITGEENLARQSGFKGAVDLLKTAIHAAAQTCI